MKYNNPYIHELSDVRLELVEEKPIDNIVYLSYVLHPKEVNECPSCHSNDIIRYGSYTRKINIKILAHKKTNVTIKATKFRCKYCKTYFNDQCEDVGKNTTIAKSTIINILMQLKRDICFKDIATYNEVDPKTVINIMENTVVAERKPFKDVLCLDEFKNLKTTNGKYAFLIYDPNRELVVDVLEDRRLDHLEDYFRSIDHVERSKVKYIVTDMNESYRTIKEEMFPNATHVVDSFHYIRYMTKAMMDLRIRIQSKFKTDNPNYKILKKNWRLLQIDIKNVEEKEIYNQIKLKNTSRCEVITDMLSVSNELQSGYELLQEFYSKWNKVKYEEVNQFMDEWISLLHNTEIKEFKELETTFKNWRNEISNSFIRFGDKRLSNGPIEGMNNRIKALKRGAFGFSNFYHFRLRIFLLINQEFTFRNPDKLLLIPRKTRKKK